MADAEVVLFDIGATLVDASVRGPAARIAAATGLSDEQRRRLDAALMTTAFADAAEVTDYLARELGVHGADAAVAEVWTAQATDAYPVEGAAAVVGALRDAGLRIGLVSNIWRPFLESARRCLPEVFEELTDPALRLYSFEVGSAKPAAALYQRAVAAARVPAGRVVMVGDSYVRDVRPAAGLGLRTVWVLRRREREAASLAAIDAGAAPAPSATVAAVADVTPGLVAALPDAVTDRDRVRVGRASGAD